MVLIFHFKCTLKCCLQFCLNLDQSKILSSGMGVNPLADNKILSLPKLKAFADNKLNVTQNVKVFFHRIENIVGKEENAGYQHYLLFPQCYHKAFSSNASKFIIEW